MQSPRPAFSPVLALILAAAMAPGVFADVRLPAVIADHMVVQQNASAPIWGWADAGEDVSVSTPWLKGPVSTKAGPDGRWMVRLPTPGAAEVKGPFTLTIAGRNTVEVRDAVLGEVWVASGQSNMEWPVAAAANAKDAVAKATNPMVRLFNVRNQIAARPRGDVETDGGWRACTPETAAGFSAVAYFFAQDLQATLGVPVGVIEADWGGTPVQAWTNLETVAKFPEFAADVARLMDLDQDPNVRAARQGAAGATWWDRLDTHPKGPGAGWAGTGFDDGAWTTFALPATFGPDGLDRFDGVVYCRRTVTLDAADADKPATLTLGPIDDRDDAWVNGVHVGGTRDDGKWNQARSYSVPKGVLKAGPNTVAVRVVDTGGKGGINGEAKQLSLDVGGHVTALAGDWKIRKGPAMTELPAIGELPPIGPNTPTSLYNAMIHPLVPYAIRGAIWYQGESNRGQDYGTYFPAMIRQWRSAWGQGDFPFLFVQIAPYNYGNDRGQTALLRDAQTFTLDSVPNTGMAVTMDVGNPADIHPTNKKDVGERLARWAKAKTYGVSGVVACGPRLKAWAPEGAKAVVTFDLMGATGLKGTPTNFAVAGEDHVFYQAAAELRGADQVVVSSPKVQHPAAVRYGWCNACETTLSSDAGLPAVPFRTDAWEAPAGGWLPPEDAGKTSFLTDDPAFEPLFDGQSLKGWTPVNVAPSTFGVVNGMIHCTGHPTGVLRTDRAFENFILELEWRHLDPQGNSGLFVWSDAVCAKGVPFTRAVEVQVMTGAEADWYTSDGDVFPIHGATMTPDNPRPKGGQRAYPTEKRMRPSPEWNHYRVTCIDGQVELAVNGKKVTSGHNVTPRDGYICLEAEGSPIDFRNIRIKTLPSSGKGGAATRLPTGFVALFNGLDFEGWKFTKEHEGHFVASDNVISTDGKGTDLWTAKSYKDFVLIADWRWTRPPVDNQRPVILPSGDEKKGPDGKTVTQLIKDAGDSGIYLRGSSKSQVNAWCWPIGSGEVYGYRTDASMPPEVRAGVTPKAVADAALGQWNRFEITMKGDRLTVVLNGTVVIENAQLPGVAAEGPIALQQHGDPIEFTNLFIRELKD